MLIIIILLWVAQNDLHVFIWYTIGGSCLTLYHNYSRTCVHAHICGARAQDLLRGHVGVAEPCQAGSRPELECTALY